MAMLYRYMLTYTLYVILDVTVYEFDLGLTVTR